MKKILNKASEAGKKITKPFRKKQPVTPARITTETLAEHREQVLAGGRRFKYPIQYARHRLVFNTIIIAVAVLIGLVVLGWVQLYQSQNSSDFMYRVTRVLPLPVASVDGESVPYADYLMRYRGAAHYKAEKEQVKFDTPEGQSQANHIKRQEMNNTISSVYAAILAKQLNVTVADSDVQLFLKQQRSTPSGEVSETTYNAFVLSYYGWSPDEYQFVIKAKLLQQKVAYAIDKDATAAVTAAENQIKAGNTDLKTVADSLNANKANTATYGNSGNVPKENLDGGLAAAAAKLQVGGVSGVIKPSTDAGDGYYFVKLIATDGTTVNYDYVHISLKEFAAQLKKLYDDNKIKEYITIPEVE